ncbi:MAG: hypothetical protein DMG54_25695 [Acidobacteria bacterium]|nr:MAG: hypothetical protein DMG54_25695 [Acidobacteriota bacterium]PYU69970.1 MAG: hypothetical protein DMG52_27295 [Acidobacteriota bacterium]
MSSYQERLETAVRAQKNAQTARTDVLLILFSHLSALLDTLQSDSAFFQDDRLTSPGKSKVAGRLQPGATQARAQAELDLIHRRLLEQQLLEVEQPGQRTQQFVRESHLVLRPAQNGLTSGLREQYALP